MLYLGISARGFCFVCLVVVNCLNVVTGLCKMTLIFALIGCFVLCLEHFDGVLDFIGFCWMGCLVYMILFCVIGLLQIFCLRLGWVLWLAVGFVVGFGYAL